MNLNPKRRFAWGFGLGLLLATAALFLMGAGHGTYAPMVANISLLGLIPLVGILIGIFGPPLLWGLYFLLIPTIDSRGRKLVALVLVAVLHLVPGCWLAYEDSAFARMFEANSWLIFLHGFLLVTTILLLTFITLTESKESVE